MEVSGGNSTIINSAKNKSSVSLKKENFRRKPTKMREKSKFCIGFDAGTVSRQIVTVPVTSTKIPRETHENFKTL